MCTTREERQQLAKAFLAYYQSVEDSFPSLSPKEEEWLVEEQKRIRRLESLEFYAALGRLERSEVWLRNELKQSVGGLKQRLQKIVAEENASREIIEWVELAKMHLNGEHPFEALQDLAVSPERQQAILKSHFDGGSVPNGYEGLPKKFIPPIGALYAKGFEYNVSIAHEILGRVVDPYLTLKVED